MVGVWGWGGRIAGAGFILLWACMDRLAMSLHTHICIYVHPSVYMCLNTRTNVHAHTYLTQAGGLSGGGGHLPHAAPGGGREPEQQVRSDV